MERSAKLPSPNATDKPPRQNSKVNEIHEQLAAMERSAQPPPKKAPSPGVAKSYMQKLESGDSPRLVRSPSSTESPAGKMGEEVAKTAEEERRVRMEEAKRLRKLKDDEDRRRTIEEEKKRAAEEELLAEQKRARDMQKKAEEQKRRESYKAAFEEAQRKKASASSPPAS